jgi:hypothetical protein
VFANEVYASIDLLIEAGGSTKEEFGSDADSFSTTGVF